MKHFILISFLLSASVLCFSQKKVAVLETVTGEDSNVTSLEKAIIRGELRKAIFRVDGFEAITRTDLDQIFQEQDFQYTGSVPKDQIHRLGQMSGADYLCISTLNKSESQFYIEAYLIDVSTGEIESPASQFGVVKNGNMADLYEICQILIKELIGDKIVTGGELIEETFDKNTWGWTTFSHDAKSVIVANDELRITNYANRGTTQSDVMVPLDLRRNFKMTFNFVIQEVKMQSSVGIKFGGNNNVTVNSHSCICHVGSSNKSINDANIGKGRNQPVVIDLIKNGENLTILVNGIEICNEICALSTNQMSVFAGANTLAMLKKVTIQYIR